MSKGFYGLMALLLMSIVFSAQAQLLPDNNQLNAAAVQRWMETNREIAPIIQQLDLLNPTEESLKNFETLSPAQQDLKIDIFLRGKNLLERANQITSRYGWKSVGEYMRFSSKLGNAIAAYFSLGELKTITSEQAEALRAKVDPAVLAVPKTDIEFIQAHEHQLQQYIKAYAAGREK